MWILTSTTQGTASQPCPNPSGGTASAGDGVIYTGISPVYWQNVGPIRGPLGSQGNQGNQGSQGNQGNQGSQGNQGDQGYQGYQGDGFSSTVFTNKTAPFTAFTIDKNNGTAAFIEYFIYETNNSYYRAGTMVAVWDKTANTITMNELTTQDLNGTTLTFVFTAAIVTPNVIITATIATGNWTVKISARII
jgi:hypothetical protein